MQIKTTAYTINASSPTEALNILLELNSFTIDSFAKYMQVDASTLKTDAPPKWAINYLKDQLETNLIHLGYIFKDTKTDGILKPIEDLEKELSEIKLNNAIDTQIPASINKDIVTEQGAIKVAYIANFERLLRDFKENIEKK